MEELRPFTIDIPSSALTDLHTRIDNTRWPDEEVVGDASQGVRLRAIKDLVDHWRNDYDWRRCEAAINAYPQVMTTIDDTDIHCLHVRSRHSDALPMIMTHGWPGSIVEFLKVIGPLTDPEAHGGTAEDAFHLVVPSVPGFGFSGKPRESGWTVARIAAAWEVLMQRLGYARYVAQGGDVGAAVSSKLGERASPALMAIHTSQPFVLPPPPYENLSEDEQQMLDDLGRMQAHGIGYAVQQGTRPQTLGYALADSPVGQAAWIYEKLSAWTDSSGDPERVLTRDEMLDNIMIYWLTNSATSSARFYWDNHGDAIRGIPINVPVGVTIFPGELYRAPRSWAGRFMKTIFYWNEVDRGGHFAAFEQPGLFVQEMRNCFRHIRLS